jgi:flagellar brake protein
MGAASPIKEQEDPCIVTASSDIQRIMKDLFKAQSFVTVGMNGGKKMSSMILDVDTKSGYFIYEAGQEDEVQAVMASGKLFFSATLRGVSVRFSVASVSSTTFEAKPALRSPMPVDMEYLQRREYFRTTFIKPYVGTVKLPDGKPAVLDLKDISVGGIGMQSMTVTSEMLPPGSMVDATLDFAELGKLDVTLKVSTHRKIDKAGRITHQFGCSFYNLARNKEPQVQRLVFALDQLFRANRMD